MTLTLTEQERRDLHEALAVALDQLSTGILSGIQEAGRLETAWLDLMDRLEGNKRFRVLDLPNGQDG
jgi:hypothetical protein